MNIVRERRCYVCHRDVAGPDWWAKIETRPILRGGRSSTQYICVDCWGKLCGMARARQRTKQEVAK